MSNKRVNPFKLKLHLLECEADEKDKKISDLETKLAESEHRNKQLVDALNGEVFINYKLPMENAQLKQQLAEKEKEIEYFESEWKSCQQKLDHYIGECLKLKDEQNQKAIEEFNELRK